MNFEIKWYQDNSDYFFYGSKVKFNHDKSVSFRNDIMSPGTSIVRWSSKLPFQSNRILMELPLLKRNQKYQLTVDSKSIPENKFFVLITFFDRFDNKVGMEVIKNSNQEFVYLEDAYNYQIELINKGARIIEFDKLVISDSVD
ncbi:accessory Sec system protein Asp3 [Companilactobacillus sp. RD055328]|uniref:accessory Sec system protein Asp3 n=1 Tax=Companilactobacillus sp. RD055328 TaxID=2916634 RepID=UPI001FC857A7|nr:accessory Sec system protein Asp3 [Companilactobacillus sp. RD055328]GKQ42750.1 accessory Sec system protein Asp3 [Companilactobacillus sp. RD055328]